MICLDGEKNRDMGSKRGEEGLSKGLLLVRGVPVKIVGHEEYIGSRRDEGVARFHNLKAEETERTYQFSCENERRRTVIKGHKTGSKREKNPSRSEQ